MCNQGRRVVVDVDLEKFFDRVNHDILIDRLRRRIADAGVIRLVRAYLTSGVLMNGIVVDRDEGTPQGGPLSPLLANVLLDEVDKELERRGHCFVRYADDANVYVRSRRAGERVMRLLRRLYGRLRLKVNEAKSTIASVFRRKFLGYSFWVAPGGKIKRRVAYEGDGNVQAARSGTDPPILRAQPERGGQTTACLCVGMEGLLPAGGYSRSLERSGPMDTPPSAGHPTQAMETRHNHLSRTAEAGSFIRSGGTGGGQYPSLVAQQRNAPAYGAESQMGRRTGNPSTLLTSTSRTAGCGPACPVVWEGRRGDCSPLSRLFFPQKTAEPTVFSAGQRRARCSVAVNAPSLDFRRSAAAFLPIYGLLHSDLEDSANNLLIIIESAAGHAARCAVKIFLINYIQVSRRALPVWHQACMDLGQLPPLFFEIERTICKLRQITTRAISPRSL